MVLGDVIAIEAGALVSGDDLEAPGVIARERRVVPVEVIEDAEFQALSPAFGARPLL
jgi:hypothetical protein